MKKLLALAILFTPLLSFAQAFKIDSLTSQAKYDTVYTSSLDKEALYLRLKGWVDATFTSSKGVIEQDDKQAGQIFLKGIIIVDQVLIDGAKKLPAKFNASFKCRLYIKDRKIKAVITSINFGGSIIDSMEIDISKKHPELCLQSAFDSMNIKFPALLADINKAINSKSEGEF